MSSKQVCFVASGCVWRLLTFPSLRYHDMPDVIDFLVLRQSYDEALHRNWQPSKVEPPEPRQTAVE